MTASAFGLFGGMLGAPSEAEQAVRRPTDAPMLILYLADCATWEELAEVEAAIQRHRPSADVLVLTPILASRAAALCSVVDTGEMAALGLLP